MIPRRILLLSVLLASFSQLAAYICVPAVPTIERELPGTSGERIVAVYLVVVAICQLVWGPVSDGLGRRRTIMAGVVLGAAGSALCAVSAGGTQLVLGRIMQAAGFSSCLVNSRAVLRDRFDGEALGRAMASATVWIAVVPTLTPTTGGALTDWLGWRAPFAFTLVAASVLPPLLTWTLSADADRKPVRFSQYLRCLRDRQLLLGSIAGGCHFGALNAFTVGVPGLGRQVAGLGPTQVGILISAMTPMFIAGALIASVRPGLGSRRAVLAGMVSQICCVTASLFFLRQGWLMAVLACAVVYGVLQGILLPALMARALGLSGAAAGISASFFGSLQLLGGGVSAWLSPVFAAGLGVLGTGTLMLVLLIGAIEFVRRT